MNAARRRLVEIFQLLSRIEKEKITSLEIEKLTGFSRDSIRRDFSNLKITFGKSNGYDVALLKEKIAGALNLENNEKKCCVIGLGKIGEALLDSDFFEGTPFKVVAGFDSNVNRTEILRSAFPLHPLSRLKAVSEEKKIDFAILAVDDNEAQKTAEIIESCNIKGIVNFTRVALSTKCEVENVNPVFALNLLVAKKS